MLKKVEISDGILERLGGLSPPISACTVGAVRANLVINTTRPG